MLYFLHGSREFTKNELIKLKSALLKKRPDAIALSFDENSSEDINIEELASGQGLFQSRYIVELNGLFSAKIFQKEKEAVERMQNSENIFFVLEDALPKKTLDLLKEKAEKTSEEKTVKLVENKKFSAFSLSDALVRRDKKQLWILYREAVKRGYAIEELHGILFWQAKLIILAHKTSSAEEAGVKQYPYSKTKPAVKLYSLKEAEELLHKLSVAILEGRSGKVTLEHAVEKVILSL